MINVQKVVLLVMINKKKKENINAERSVKTFREQRYSYLYILNDSTITVSKLIVGSLKRDN